jgi:ketopantoate reductase
MIEPDEQQIAELMASAGADGDGPKVMLNLNRYRERPSYAEVTISDEIVGATWTKWVFIASIGAATSLMRATVGEIVCRPRWSGVLAVDP